MKEEANDILRNKLLEVAQPDMERAWTDMEKLLDRGLVSPSKHTLKKLLRHPLIWLNSVLFGVLLLGASFLINIKSEPYSAQPNVPSNTAGASSFSGSFIDYLIPFQSINVEPDITTIRVGAPVVNTAPSPELLLAIDSSPLWPMRSKRKVFFGYKDQTFDLEPSWGVKGHSIDEYVHPIEITITLEGHAGIFPEVSGSDFFGQLGFDGGIRIQSAPRYFMEAKAGYNPVSVRPFDRNIDRPAFNGLTINDKDQIQRLNYWDIKLGFGFDVNPKMRVFGGSQLSVLNSVFGDRERLKDDGVSITSTEMKAIEISDLDGISTSNLGFYGGVELTRKKWQFRTSIQYGLLDFTQNDYFSSSAFNTFSNFRFGVGYDISKIRI